MIKITGTKAKCVFAIAVIAACGYVLQGIVHAPGGSEDDRGKSDADDIVPAVPAARAAAPTLTTPEVIVLPAQTPLLYM